MERLSRTKLLLGEQKLEKLKESTVAVFGVGGVGGYVCESLARSGVGKIILIDGDVVALSNINRQIIATMSTVGKQKTEVMKDRILDINPECEVVTYNMFFEDSTKDIIDLSSVDYIADCIDRVTNKIALIKLAKDKGIKIISAMGAGNKLDATRFVVEDIYKTSVCPLCKVMRKELSKIGVDNLKVVYSTEQPLKNQEEYCGKAVCGSISYVPSVMGLIMSGEIIKDL